MIEEIRNTLFGNCKQKLFKMFGLSFETIQNYNQAVENDDYPKMREILHTIDPLNRKETLALLIELTREPLIYTNYLLSPDEVSMRGMNMLQENFSQEQMIDLICEFRKTIDTLEDDDEAQDFDFVKWLRKKI